MNKIERDIIEQVKNSYIIHECGQNSSPIDFNLFNIFFLNNVETIHSLFIAELLRPNGRHKQGNLFLELFLKQLKINDFEITKEIIVETEHYAGQIDLNYDEGGRIDIVIYNTKGQAIFIENKIYAGDQKKQLIRYYNYSKKFINPRLYYLTLFGTSPSEYSIKSENYKLEINCNDFIIISYHKEILIWLETCINQSTDNSVKETIKQYLNTVKKLTNQTLNDKMKNEIKELLVTNIDYFDSFESIRFITDEIKSELTVELINELNNRIRPEHRIIKLKSNGINIHPEFMFDEDGFALVFWGYDNDVKILKNGNCEEYEMIFKQIHHFHHTYKFSGAPISWINFREPLIADNKFICDHYNNSENKEKYYQRILVEAEEYINEVLNILKMN